MHKCESSIVTMGRHLGCYQQTKSNSNEASWLANGKPCRCYYTCDHMIFMKWVISLNNRTVMC